MQLLTSLRHRGALATSCDIIHPLMGLIHIPALGATWDIPAVNSPQTIPLNRGDVVEIQGPAASGKSHLIYHLLATCILPPSFDSADIGGWACAAVLVDADGKFSIKRFRHLLLARLSKCISSGLSAPSSDSHELEELAIQCLSRLHVVRPQSSTQAASTLMHLPEYHSAHPSLRSEEIGLLAIDSLSAFYWIDRFLAEQWRSVDHPSSADPTEPISPMRQITIALQRVRTSRGPLTILANWGLNPSKGSAHVGETYPLYKQHLHPFPSPFDGAVTTTSPSRPPDCTTQAMSSSCPAPSNLTQSVGTSEPSVSPSSRQDFAITHHITLSPIPTVPSTSLSTSSETEECAVSEVTQNTLHGFLRTSGNIFAMHFAFRISADDVVFESSAQT